MLVVPKVQMWLHTQPKLNLNSIEMTRGSSKHAPYESTVRSLLLLFREWVGRRIGTDIGTNPTSIGDRCSMSACGSTLSPSVNIAYRGSANQSSATSVPTSISARMTLATNVSKTPLVPRAVRHIGTDIGTGPIDIGHRCQRLGPDANGNVGIGPIDIGYRCQFAAQDL